MEDTKPKPEQLLEPRARARASLSTVPSDPPKAAKTSAAPPHPQERDTPLKSLRSLEASPTEQQRQKDVKERAKSQELTRIEAEHGEISSEIPISHTADSRLRQLQAAVIITSRPDEGGCLHARELDFDRLSVPRPPPFRGGEDGGIDSEAEEEEADYVSLTVDSACVGGEKETSDFDGWLRRVCVRKHERGLSIRHAQERREGAQSPCPSPMTPSLSVYVSSAVSAAYSSDADTGTDPNDTDADGRSLVFAYPSSL